MELLVVFAAGVVLGVLGDQLTVTILADVNSPENSFKDEVTKVVTDVKTDVSKL